MKRSNVYAAVVILLVASAGIVTFIARSNTLSDRLPASIRRGANVSAQKHLLEDMQVMTETDRVGIQLGHFLTKNSDGNAAYACDVYREVTLSFVGEGIADSGDKPVMEVTAPCEETADSNKMVPVWIPLHELRGRSPSNADVAGPAGEQTRVKFQNIGTEWPSQWSLQGVRLSGDNDLAVTGDELRTYVKKPVVIHW